MSLRSRDAIACAAVWVPYALLVRKFWFVTEDAFISLRYSRHWAEGHGLVFNLGEKPPVEGYLRDPLISQDDFRRTFESMAT